MIKSSFKGKKTNEPCLSQTGKTHHFLHLLDETRLPGGRFSTEEAQDISGCTDGATPDHDSHNTRVIPTNIMHDF